MSEPLGNTMGDKENTFALVSKTGLPETSRSTTNNPTDPSPGLCTSTINNPIDTTPGLSPFDPPVMEVTPDQPSPARFGPSRRFGSPARGPHPLPASDALRVSLSESREEGVRLERLYTEQLLKNTRLHQDYERLEFELLERTQELESHALTASELTAQNQALIASLTSVTERAHLESLAASKIQVELEAQLAALARLERERGAAHSLVAVQLDTADEQYETLRKEYVALDRRFKVLQANYDFELTAKSALVGQIETLEADRSRLRRELQSLAHQYDDLSDHYIHLMVNIDDLDESEFSDEGADILGELERVTLGDSDSEGEAQPLQNLAAELSRLQACRSADRPGTQTANLSEGEATLEPKDLVEGKPEVSEFSELTKGYTFPSPQKARVLSTSTPRQPRVAPLELDCTLRSMKLNSSNGTSPTKSMPSPSFSSHQKRHSRTMSTDILPVQVEFEPLPCPDRPQLGKASQRSRVSSIASSRVSSLHRTPHTNDSHSGSRISSLHGTPHSNDSRSGSRISSLQGSPPSHESGGSFRQSSSPPVPSRVLSGVLSGGLNDDVREEVTRLRFELQSVKLQNEKLMSFIGFELQQQTGRRALEAGETPSMEYADAKLITQSQKALRHMRILRSVSVASHIQRRRSIPGLRSKRSIAIIDAEGNQMDLSSLANSSFEDEPVEDEPHGKIHQEELLAPISAIRVHKKRPFRAKSPRSVPSAFQGLRGLRAFDTPVRLLLRGIDVTRMFHEYDLDVE